LKFKSIGLLFNLLSLSFLLILCLVPSLFFPGFGSQFGGRFWWSIGPVFFLIVVLLGFFNAYYAGNRRLYALLEAEDWPALSVYLEDRVIRRRRFSPRLVLMLAHTYFILTDWEAIISLEDRLSILKPKLLDRCALIFGAARILARDYEGAERFFRTRWTEAEGNPRLRAQASWLRWYYGFVLLLSYRIPEAADIFIPLAQTRESPLIVGLSAWFLSSLLKRSVPDRGLELSAAAETGRQRVRKVLPRPGDWEAEQEKIKGETHGLVLSRQLNKAAVWIYSSERPGMREQFSRSFLTTSQGA